MYRRISRRSFIGRVAAASGALVLPETMWRRPHRMLRPVTVTGRVRTAGVGVASVAVTDGITIVETDAAGRYVLPSNSRQSFVYISMPRGYQIPRNAMGTANFYRPMPAPDVGELQADFELSPLDRSDDRHAFVALADPQTQDGHEMELLHKETVPDLQETVRALGSQPIFGISVGDIMFDDLSLYPEYERAVDAIGIPFFQVVGNHDLDFEGMTDLASTKTFSKHFGPRYYSFDRGDVHYVVLDDVFWNHTDYMGYLDDTQLAWLSQDLARVPGGNPVVVFVHIPPFSTQFSREGEDEPSMRNFVTNRQALYNLLEPFDAHVVAGHTHENEHVFEGGPHQHVLGTTCGAWWTGPICYDGTPTGYGVFDVNGRDIRWRYKSTGLPEDYQMRVYPRGADPEAPDEFVANVWDWDPKWSVVWYENGVRRGLMARRVGKDPLSLKLHNDENLPEHRKWVKPTPSNHLFYAPIDEGSPDIVVEATNRWG